MRRALLTGAGGFLGKRVAAELESNGIEVRRLRCRWKDARAEPLFRLNDGAPETGELVDLLEKTAPEAIFHLAGTTHAPQLFEVNVDYAMRLISAARHLRLDATIVLAGSAAEYGDVEERQLPVSETCPCRPVTPYGISKHAQTLIGLAAATAGSRVVVARLFNVVGRGMARHLPLMDIALRLAASQGDGRLSVGDLDLERDFVDAAGAARGLVGLTRQPKALGQVFNLCSGRGIWLRDVVERMAGSIPWPVTMMHDATLSRLSQPRRMIGDPAKLASIGLVTPPPNFDRLLPILIAEASLLVSGDRRVDRERQSAT